ncbi:OmpA family protein [Lampropedia puyangensis]|uniref:OmpA family protein n=1 Tax=Lampropedia puyangensis TaxID=1330072 RepID=A0A4V4GSM9_9BURK|nr:OmpA family protein [Lampropedia puyangensis]
MSQQDKDTESRIALFLVFGLIAATVIGVVWFGAHSVLKKKTAAPVELVSSIPASTVPEQAHDQPFVLESGDLARFYFTKGQAVTAEDAKVQPTLTKLLELVKTGGFLQLLPFNGGQPETAAADTLVQARIEQLRAQLLRLGVPADKLQVAAVQIDADSKDWAHAQRIDVVAKPAAQPSLAQVGPAGLAPSDADATEDGPRVAVENGVVKFYFAVGSDTLAQGASEALLDVIAAVNSGKRAIVSGFTDPTGDAALNEELSKKRAFAVRDTLIQLNVPEDKIELEKPQSYTGTGNNAEARRVEVRIEG